MLTYVVSLGRICIYLPRNIKDNVALQLQDAKIKVEYEKDF